MCTATVGNKHRVKAARPIPLTFGLLMIVVSSFAFGGAADPPSVDKITSRRPVPLHHLYFHFLRFQSHLDKRAVTLEQEGRTKDAQELRNQLQKELGFTNAQIVTLRRTSLQMDKNLDAIRLKAQPIIYEDRQWLRLNGRSAGPPPGHAQVHELQNEYEAVILKSVADLNRKLGPAAASQLQARIEKEWAPRVTVHKFPSHLSHDPKIDSKKVTPFHLEAQQ